MNGHKIVNQDGLLFMTPTAVGCIDVFTRSTYRVSAGKLELAVVCVRSRLELSVETGSL